MDLRVELARQQVQDFVWTWQSECLIQDRVLKLFKDNGFTGYQVKPVNARFNARTVEEPSRLWEIVVTGWAGVAPEESGVRLLENCPSCGYMKYKGLNDASLLIKEDQWDGSDFFMVWPYPRFIFVTNRVAELVKDHKLKGVQLKDLPALTLEHGGREAGPGRLSYWMPDDRARELGEPLGIY